MSKVNIYNNGKGLFQATFSIHSDRIWGVGKTKEDAISNLKHEVEDIIWTLKNIDYNDFCYLENKKELEGIG